MKTKILLISILSVWILFSCKKDKKEVENGKSNQEQQLKKKPLTKIEKAIKEFYEEEEKFIDSNDKLTLTNRYTKIRLDKSIPQVTHIHSCKDENYHILVEPTGSVKNDIYEVKQFTYNLDNTINNPKTKYFLKEVKFLGKKDGVANFKIIVTKDEIEQKPIVINFENKSLELKNDELIENQVFLEHKAGTLESLEGKNCAESRILKMYGDKGKDWIKNHDCSSKVFFKI